MLPHVVLHVEASLDGRIDWIEPDIGRFYRLAAGFAEDAILTGADTLLEGPGLPEEDDAEALGGSAPLQAGEERVDLRAALEALVEQHGVRTVRVDSGGALSGALLRAGLLSEVSVLLEPVLVGGVSPRMFMRGPDPASAADLARLELLDVQHFDDGLVWLRYVVAGSAPAVN